MFSVRYLLLAVLFVNRRWDELCGICVVCLWCSAVRWWEWLPGPFCLRWQSEQRAELPLYIYPCFSIPGIQKALGRQGLHPNSPSYYPYCTVLSPPKKSRGVLNTIFVPLKGTTIQTKVSNWIPSWISLQQGCWAVCPSKRFFQPAENARALLKTPSCGRLRALLRCRIFFFSVKTLGCCWISR